MASPLLQFYNVDPKLLLPSGVNDLEAAKEIKNFYFNKKRPLAQKYIEVFVPLVKFHVSYHVIFLVR